MELTHIIKHSICLQTLHIEYPQSRQLVSIFKTKGKDSCKGDSGGPLMVEQRYKNKYRWVLIGLVSFGSFSCGTHGVPGVYTNVRYYLKWISDKIQYHTRTIENGLK